MGQLLGSGTVALDGATLTLTTVSGRGANFAGVIGGTGGVTKSLSSAVTFTGNNTYTGGTTISAGTLQLGDGGTAGSIIGAVTDNGMLIFNRSDSSTFAGNISGTGAIQKLGSGTLTLTGTNTYTGTTTISAGKLVVSNSTGSGTGTGAVNVTAGALGGAGTISGLVTVSANAHLAPGASPGTLNLTGGLTLNANAILDWELANSLSVDGGVNDFIAVTGNVSISNATLNISAINGDLANGTYTLITYSGTLSTGGPDINSLWTIGTNNAATAHTYQFSTATPNEIDLIVGPVPEPSIAALAFVPLLIRRRKRR
jgi:fibronectin-binding autotransporter adhesin